jgi:hypothetical protein
MLHFLHVEDTVTVACGVSVSGLHGLAKTASLRM